MTMLHAGLAAAGVACVAIPIIIHLLFRRKRKIIFWGAMRFLLEAHRKQRRRLTLEQLLLLLARCMVVLLAALAIGRPMLERAGVLGSGAQRTVYLLIDNALPSGALTASGTSALDRHKRDAKDIIKALGASDRVGLIAMGSPADGIVVPASSDHAAVAHVIDGLTATDSACDIAGSAERLRTQIDSDSDDSGTNETIVFFLSDFYTGSADADTSLPRAFDGLPGVRVLATSPAQTSPGDVQILSVEPLAQVILSGSGSAENNGEGASSQVRVALQRTGPIVADRMSTTLRLRAIAGASGSGGASAETVVRWRPGENQKTVSLPINLSRLAGDTGAGVGGALLASIDRDALDADNTLRRPIALRDSIRVGLIARRRFGAAPSIDRLDASDWVRVALRPSESSPIEITDIDPAAIDAPSLAGLGAAVLTRPDLVDDAGWRRLGDFVRRSGLLVVCPPTETQVHVWADAMTEELGLPWRIGREARAFDPPMSLASEQPTTAALDLIRGELEDLVAPVDITRMLPIEEASSRSGTILALADGSPWIVVAAPGVENTNEETDSDEHTRGQGMVVFLTSPPALSWTDLPAKPLMVPLVHQIIRHGIGSASAAWSSVAGNRALAPQRTTELVPIDVSGSSAAATTRPAIVNDLGVTTEPVRNAGLFRAVDALGGSRGIVAVNHDSNAAGLDVQSPPVVRAWLEGLGAEEPIRWVESSRATDNPGGPVEAGEAGKPGGMGGALASVSDSSGAHISLPLLIGALFFALAETIMARFFSHATRDNTPASSGASSGGVAA